MAPSRCTYGGRDVSHQFAEGSAGGVSGAGRHGGSAGQPHRGGRAGGPPRRPARRRSARARSVRRVAGGARATTAAGRVAGPEAPMGGGCRRERPWRAAAQVAPTGRSGSERGAGDGHSAHRPRRAKAGSGTSGSALLAVSSALAMTACSSSGVTTQAPSSSSGARSLRAGLATIVALRILSAR